MNAHAIMKIPKALIANATGFLMELNGFLGETIMLPKYFAKYIRIAPNTNLNKNPNIL